MFDFVVILLVSTTLLPRVTGTHYSDTLKESVLSSRLFDVPPGRNWRYFFSEDMDIDNDGVLSDGEKRQKIETGMELFFRMLDKNNDAIVSKEEITSPSLDLEAAIELAFFFFDVPPCNLNVMYGSFRDRMFMYGSGLYHSFRDRNDDGFLNIQDIEESQPWKKEQKEIIGEVFTFFDENNDNKLSMDDLKPKLKPLLTLMFKICDQNNDGVLSLEDINFKIQSEDLTSILPMIKEKYMSNGEVDLNHYLVPFELDANGDGVMNNRDLYLIWLEYPHIYPAATIMKLLDQDQDGIFKFENINISNQQIGPIYD